VFTGAAFLSALLLFSVEPMLGKMLLPSLGGSPQVWNTCMGFFQVVLLLGYAYAHFSVKHLGVRSQALLHVVVLLVPLASLPIALPAGAAATRGGGTILGELALLSRAALLPFLVLATSGPLLARWYAAAAPGRDAYRLYAASNAGSLLALVAYPVIVEPLLPTGVQARLWALGYLVLAGVVVACALVVRGAPSAAVDVAPETLPERRPRARTIARWVACAFVPASLLLGTTNAITTDMSPAPFLWVLPLVLYLVTFIVAFGSWSGALPRWARVALVVSVLSVALAVARRATMNVLPAHLAAFFFVALGVHGRLASEKPAAALLTEFFLWVSVGGALAGIFNMFVAPAIFRGVGQYVEYPLMLVLGIALLPAEGGSRPAGPRAGGRPWLSELALLAAVAAAALGAGFVRAHVGVLAASLLPLAIMALASRRPGRLARAMAVFLLLGAEGPPGATLFVERTPFGILRVTGEGEQRVLRHGTTLHGVEDDRQRDADGRHRPGSYYHPEGPLGSLLAKRAAAGIAAGRVAAVGLGTGSAAYYAAPSEAWTFYEIDPTVTKVARDATLFHFLGESRAASIAHVTGDARLALASEADGGFDLLMLDAFSSDSVPTHLVTAEAFRLYASKLARGGLIAVHVSNRHFRLAPVVAAGADASGLAARERFDDVDDGYRRPSHWMVLGSAASLAALELPAEWRPRAATGQPWRDDFANLVSALR